MENPFGDVSTSATFYFIIRLQIISQIEKQPAAGSSGQSSLFCFTYADQTFIAAILRETANDTKGITIRQAPHMLNQHPRSILPSQLLMLFFAGNKFNLPEVLVRCEKDD